MIWYEQTFLEANDAYVRLLCGPSRETDKERKPGIREVGWCGSGGGMCLR